MTSNISAPLTLMNPYNRTMHRITYLVIIPLQQYRQENHGLNFIERDSDKSVYPEKPISLIWVWVWLQFDLSEVLPKQGLSYVRSFEFSLILLWQKQEFCLEDYLSGPTWICLVRIDALGKVQELKGLFKDELKWQVNFNKTLIHDILIFSLAIKYEIHLIYTLFFLYFNIKIYK